MDPTRGLESVAGVLDMQVFASTGAPRGHLFIEVPHGATRRSDYEAVERLLTGTLPEDLIHFFFVNTDIGAPEGAARLGAHLAAQGFTTVVARCLIPRTFIDTNRVIAKTTQGVVVDGLTPGLPGYLDSKDDAQVLLALHARYHAVVQQAYAQLCGEGQGLALQLHSFAPRSVGIEKTDASIVEALHAAYVPEVYATWPKRPPVDFISKTADGSFSTAPQLVAAAKAAYVQAGIAAEENATYHLHPATMGMVYAQAWPTQVLCVELNRDLVADPFVPFGVSPINAQKVERAVAPLGQALGEALARRAV
jgi:N-formylglutamate amidohydrolase